ncbi:MAG: hypothetical protein OEV40_13460 [Acidimicrobiia bacterium]|nr:hypothetical protein [Acidimicrobiia bacterium]
MSPRPSLTTRSPRPTTRWRWALLAALGLVAASCGEDDAQTGVVQLVDEDTTVVVANSPGTLTTNGPQRVLVALVGSGPNAFIGADDQPAVVELEAVGGSAAGEVTAEWLSNPGVELGLYVATFTFDEPGVWQVGIKGADESLAAALVDVADDSSVPEAGDPAPRSETPTGASLDELSTISTDPNPEPDFYDLSVAEAVENGRPTVIVFATPQFCRTAICGPTVEIAKDIASGHDGIDFVHVEPFDIEAARAGALEPIEAMFDWGLVTEPWVFVVDDTGVISASFEGIVGAAELERALGEL